MPAAVFFRCCLALLSCVGLGSQAWASNAPVEERHWLCEVVYMPARSTWRREVSLSFDQRRVLAMKVDGVKVYSFQVQGSVIATALDNERIQFDTRRLEWRSDFRGAASGQGRCELGPPPN